MKDFFNEALKILGNQKGELDLGGEESAETGSGNDDMSTEGLLASLDSESESEGGSEQSESESTEENSEADGESLEEQLKAYEGEKEGESVQLLEELNKLGILNKGMPVEFDDAEKVKEYLSKGFDYTQKTQELAELRKTAEAEIEEQRQNFESEREAFQKEIQTHQQQLTNYGIFQRMIQDIQRRDPELFEELDGYYKQQESQYSQVVDNPEVNALKQQINELQKQIQGSAVNQEEQQLNEIKETWERDVTEVQKTFGPKLRSLGIRPDWNKVKEVWTADASNTMTVKGALFAQYGEQISKAMANKNKVTETRSKVASKGFSQETDSQEEIFGMKSGNSYENEAFEILKTL